MGENITENNCGHASVRACVCVCVSSQVSTEQTPVLLVAREKAKNVCLPILRRVLDTEGRPVREGDPQMWVIAEPVTFYSLKQDGTCLGQRGRLSPPRM